MKYIYSILVVFITLFKADAQLVTAVQNATTLVQNVLLGDPGITVSNITYQGAPTALGSFTANNTNLGITSGIILTTGTVLDMNGNGPHGPNNSASSGVDNNYGGYTLLSSIVGNQTHNASVLSFDFQTCSDSIEFRYVFGSEEYPEYVGSQFNDVFGFFISGPGFNGQQNIARLPNGAVVAINSVNNGNTAPAQNVPVTGPSNPQFFVNNGNGSQPPFNTSNIYIQYDGFTRVLTAKAKVECFATYRLTLAIADVGDPIFDSGIFIEAKSFKANDPLKVKYTINNPVTPTTMSEPCSDAVVRLERTNCNLNSPLVLNVTASGTATNGVDYQTIPNTITIPAGANFTEFNISPILDNLTEGNESIHIKFDYMDNCDDNRSQEIELFIQDLVPLTVTVNATEIQCPGDPAIITTQISGGGQPFTYLWSTGETTSSITVNPEITTTYTVTVTDDCIGIPITQSIIVSVPTFTPITITGTPDITELCPYIPANISAIVSGGFGGYSYQWTSSTGENLGTELSQIVTPSATTTYTINVIDACGITASHDIVYTILSPPLNVTIAPIPNICPGDSVLLTSTVTGGFGQYYYHWPHSGETTPEVWVNPFVTTDYLLVVSDECQTFSVAEFARVTVVKPTANFQMSSSVPFNNLDLTFHNLSVNGYTYEWDFGNGATSTDVHPNNMYAEPGNYEIILIATDEAGCKDTTSQIITIEEEYYIYIPNTFTFNDDRINDVFKASTLNISNLNIVMYNRWGQKIYTSDDVNFEWDGTYKGAIIQDGTYTFKVSYITRRGIEGKLTGHVNILR